MKVVIGSDHAGVSLKKEIKSLLLKSNVVFVDVGVETKDEAADYPDIAKKVCSVVSKDKGYFGILICGTGTGMSIAANKHKGIRAVVGYDVYSAKMGRKDNDCNVLCLRARSYPFQKSKDAVKVFLETKSSIAKRHKDRIQKLERGTLK